MRQEDVKENMLLVGKEIKTDAGKFRPIVLVERVREKKVYGVWVVPELGGIQWTHYSHWEDWEILCEVSNFNYEAFLHTVFGERRYRFLK